MQQRKDTLEKLEFEINEKRTSVFNLNESLNTIKLLCPGAEHLAIEAKIAEIQKQVDALSKEYTEKNAEFEKDVQTIYQGVLDYAQILSTVSSKYAKLYTHIKSENSYEIITLDSKNIKPVADPELSSYAPFKQPVSLDGTSEIKKLVNIRPMAWNEPIQLHKQKYVPALDHDIDTCSEHSAERITAGFLPCVVPRISRVDLVHEA